MLSRVSPGTWLVLVALLVAVAFLASTLYVTHEGTAIDELTEDIAGNANPSIRHLSALRTELHEIQDLVTSSFLGALTPQALRAEVQGHADRMHADMAQYAALAFFPGEHERWEGTHTDLTEAQDQVTVLLDRLDAGDVAGAARMRTTTLATAELRADHDLEELIGFDADEGSRLSTAIRVARHHLQHTLLFLDGASILLAIVLVIVGRQAARTYVAALRRARDVELRTGEKLEAVATGALRIAESVSAKDVTDVFRAAIEAASTATGAEMAALGVGSDPKTPFDPFVSRGIDAALIESKETAPRPVGVLGAVIREGRTLRLDDVTRDARFQGLPEGHGAIGPFLGAPVRHDHDVVGHLYLAKRPGARPFTEQDARAIELLATSTATAWQTATTASALRRAITAREDLLSMVSHDLRNPLSSIVMAASLMKKSMPSETAARAQIDIVARNAARMDRLITDLLTASKLKEGKLSIEPAPASIDALLGEAAEAFGFAAADKGIVLSVEPSPAARFAFCDGTRIGQVLANLIGNALKFTPRGGRIALSAARTEAEDKLCVSVRDTGPGIAAADREHLFDRYWQAHEHAARGTGLGLFIVRGIVESHGGKVWVESKEGQGSTFRFTLPLAEVAVGS